MKQAMKEIKMALLEADVNFKVVKNFVATVSERAVGADVMEIPHPRSDDRQDCQRGAYRPDGQRRQPSWPSPPRPPLW